MKILLTNNTLSHYAGTETYTYTLAVELKRLRHKVECYSPVLGDIAKKLQEQNIPCFSNMAEVAKDYDLIIGNHFKPCFDVSVLNVPIIFTLHSIYGFGVNGHPENPIQSAAHYVAISEEIQELLRSHGLDSTIIRNGIDLKRFSEKKNRREKPKVILFNSNYVDRNHPIYTTLRDACNCLCINLVQIGRDWGNIWNTEDVYNEVDMVFTLGRGALEAMACNRPVVVYGHNGADGLITKANYEQLRQQNYSGRSTEESWDIHRIIEEIKKYDNTTDYRELVKDNDITKIAKQYLSLNS